MPGAVSGQRWFTDDRRRATNEQGKGWMAAEIFEIVVKGRLSPTLVAALEGFEVSTCDDGWTHLVGWVPDQARLHSVLELLRDLNIELSSVNPVSLETSGTIDPSADRPERKSP